MAQHAFGRIFAPPLNHTGYGTRREDWAGTIFVFCFDVFQTAGKVIFQDAVAVPLIFLIFNIWAWNNTFIYALLPLVIMFRSDTMRSAQPTPF